MNNFSGVDKTLQLLLNKLELWLNHIILMLPNFVIAVLVLLFTIFIAKLIRKFTDKVLERFSHSKALNNLISNMVYMVTILVGLFFVLGILNLDKTVTSLLAGVGIIGLALGFAFQDIASNFIAGVFIATRKPFSVGDVIETNEHFGVIERINLRTVDIRRITGELVKLPNKMVFEKPLINFSYFGVRRIDLDGRVAYSEDLDRVKQVILGCMTGITGLVEKKEVEVMFKEFGESAIRFEVRFWIQYHRQFDYNQARSEAIMKIKKAFDQHKITIPFPIRTLDFGAKGGEILSEILKRDQD